MSKFCPICEKSMTIAYRESIMYNCTCGCTVEGNPMDALIHSSYKSESDEFGHKTSAPSFDRVSTIIKQKCEKCGRAYKIQIKNMEVIEHICVCSINNNLK